MHRLKRASLRRLFLRRLQVVKLITALSYCVGSSSFIFLCSSISFIIAFTVKRCISALETLKSWLGVYGLVGECVVSRAMPLRHARKHAWMTFPENSVPERPFRAYLAHLASSKTRHVETTKRALKDNAVRLKLPKMRGKGVIISVLFLRSHSAQRKAHS